MIHHVVEIIALAGGGVVTFTTMAVMLLMMLAFLLIVLLLLLLRMMLMMMMRMMMVGVVQWRGGRRGRGQSRSTRTGGCATGTSAERRRCLHRFHLRFHQGSENGLETSHFHATAAAIVRRHRLVGDVGSRRRHRHRHLFTCPRRLRHITLIGSYRAAAAIGCDAGTIGPLPKRSQTVGLPFLRDGVPVVRCWQLLQEARQHQAGCLNHHRRTGKRERKFSADSIAAITVATSLCR